MARHAREPNKSCWRSASGSAGVRRWAGDEGAKARISRKVRRWLSKIIWSSWHQEQPPLGCPWSVRFGIKLGMRGVEEGCAARRDVTSRLSEAGLYTSCHAGNGCSVVSCTLRDSCKSANVYLRCPCPCQHYSSRGHGGGRGGKH